MLNKEQSKSYEKYLMKKKAELVKYLKGKAVVIRLDTKSFP